MSRASNQIRTTTRTITGSVRTPWEYAALSFWLTKQLFSEKRRHGRGPRFWYANQMYFHGSGHDEDGRGTRGESMGVLVATRGAGLWRRDLFLLDLKVKEPPIRRRRRRSRGCCALCPCGSRALLLILPALLVARPGRTLALGARIFSVACSEGLWARFVSKFAL